MYAIDLYATLNKALAHGNCVKIYLETIRTICLFRPVLVTEEDDVDFALYQGLSLIESLGRYYSCPKVRLLVILGLSSDPVACFESKSATEDEVGWTDCSSQHSTECRKMKITDGF